MFTDIYESIHNDDLGPVIGTFNGNPVRSWDPQDSRARDIVFARERIKHSIGQGIPAEVLPGEVICTDGVVRRDTTAEFIGASYYAQNVEEQGRRVSIEEARELSAGDANIIWRPDGNVGQGAYALVVE